MLQHRWLSGDLQPTVALLPCTMPLSWPPPPFSGRECGRERALRIPSHHKLCSKTTYLIEILKKSLNFRSWNCHKSWKVLSQNFLFLELKSPGKFCLAEKIVLEFSRNNFTKNGHSRNLQSWNFPFLEFILVQELSVPGILFHGIYMLPLSPT